MFARTYVRLSQAHALLRKVKADSTWSERIRRALLQVFVDYENLARTTNLLTEAGVRDFCCVEYWRASAQDWPGLLIKEDSEMVVHAIKDNAERAIQVSAVVNGDRIDAISQAVTAGLAGKPVTIITLRVDSVELVSL